METAETAGLPSPGDFMELADQSNEQLLQRLALSVESRRRHRNKQKVVYAGYMLVCGVVGIVTMFDLVPPSFMLGTQLPFLVFIVVFSAFINWFNKRFYRRTAQQRDVVVQELARRGEERALGPLLELMDMRMSVSSKNWGASRAVFIESLGLMLDRLTPASFTELSDAQIHQLSPLLLLPEPELRAIVSVTLCRCGDARALRSLRKYEGLYRIQRLQKFNPALNWTMTWFRKRKIPTLDKEAIENVKRCCGEIEPRVKAEQRMAQLLRASDGGTEQPANQLLRGAMPDVAATPAEQLLRPGAVDSADRYRMDEEEAQTTEVEIASPVAPFSPPFAPAQQAEEEAKLTRG